MAKFSGRLAHAPVVYALCQVKFPTVGNIDETLAEAVHGSLRADYPYRLPQDMTELSMVVGGSQPTTTTSRSWLLFDRRKMSGFVISSTAVVYRTTIYKDFEYFVEQTMRGVQGVLEVFKPPVIERIGLRFVDLIHARPDENLKQYIEPPLYGFTPDLAGFQPQAMQQLIRGKTEEGQLLFRYSRGRHTASLPADLMDPSLTIQRTPRPDQESVIIDIDHFRDNADLDPDSKLIRESVLNLQGPMSTLFKSAVTQYAIGQWTTP